VVLNWSSLIVDHFFVILVARRLQVVHQKTLSQSFFIGWGVSRPISWRSVPDRYQNGSRLVTKWFSWVSEPVCDQLGTIEDWSPTGWRSWHIVTSNQSATGRLPLANQSATNRLPLANQSATGRLPLANQSATSRLPLANQSATSRLLIADSFSFQFVCQVFVLVVRRLPIFVFFSRKWP